MTGRGRTALRRSPPRGSAPRGARYVTQFQVAVLELERARRRHEREAARRRLAEIEARLAEIEASVHAKLAALAAGDDAERTPPAPRSFTRSMRY